MVQREVVFIDGMRTPFGRMGGAILICFVRQIAVLP